MGWRAKEKESWGKMKEMLKNNFMWWQKDKETLKLTTLFFSFCTYNEQRLHACVSVSVGCELELISLWSFQSILYLCTSIWKRGVSLVKTIPFTHTHTHNHMQIQIKIIASSLFCANLFFELDSRCWMNRGRVVISFIFSFFHTLYWCDDMLLCKYACKKRLITSCVK